MSYLKRKSREFQSEQGGDELELVSLIALRRGEGVLLCYVKYLTYFLAELYIYREKNTINQVESMIWDCVGILSFDPYENNLRSPLKTQIMPIQQKKVTNPAHLIFPSSIKSMNIYNLS